ncbi:hypothetical protein [Atlantibacter hermannii]|nr:hypothetical protein [Atlantibacter hermannii]
MLTLDNNALPVNKPFRRIVDPGKPFGLAERRRWHRLPASGLNTLRLAQ